MAPKIDNERLLRLEATATASENFKVGFLVRYPFGSVAGFSGQIPISGYGAMERKAAEDYVASEAARLGIPDTEFTLLPIATMFVE